MRRASSILILLLALAFSSATDTHAQTTNGTWAGWIEADEFIGALRLDLDDKGGSKITLFYAGDKRSGTVEELKVNENAVSFTGKVQPQARFAGTITGEKIHGTFDMISRSGSVAGSGKWEVRRTDPAAIEAPPKSAGSATKNELPAPSGKFAVGRRFFYWTDENRSEEITADPNDKRKLFVQLWYPAKNAKSGKAAEYFPDLNELLEKGENGDVLRSIKTHAKSDAEFAKAKPKFPVVIFSPGLGSNPLQYAAIIEDLVSHGYVVAAIDHPYDSGPFKFSDGTIIRFASDKWNREEPKDWSAEDRNRFFNERRFGWARDASFVVDQPKKLDSTVVGRIDLENLGMLGHSYGGQAASIVCASDTRFKACANLDGLAQGNSFLPDAAGNVQKQPFLFFTKAAEVTDFELKMMNMTREEYRVRDLKRLRERWKPGYKSRMATLESGAYLITYPGAKHTSFSDTLFLDQNSTKTYSERLEMSRIINQYVLAFFDKYLKKQNAPLLDGPTDPTSPVIVEFLKK
jgi:dienelactone hydrolase